jgi:signal peptidase I
MSIGRRLQRKTSRLLAKGALNSGEVILRWREVSGLPVDYDPHIQVSRAGASFTERSATKRALIHYVNIHTTGYSKFTEIKTGDVILDFPGDVEIDGLEGLQFEIGGKIYVQKNGGNELAESWDVRCNGVPVTRTVLVTLKS